MNNTIKSEVFNQDCLEAMRAMPDKCFDLAIVDPPYGIDIANMNMGLGTSPRCPKAYNRNWMPKDWDGSAPSEHYFNELFRVSDNQIIFGGNYFILPPTRSFIIWDKAEGLYGRSFAECEFVWTSFDMSARMFKLQPNQLERIHPTQKPVAIYKWLLTNYAKDGDTILDTHLGSGSSRIAAYDLGFDFTGYELDKDYFEAQEQRFANHIKQPTLFEPEKTVQVIKQPTLFEPEKTVQVKL
jgi:site-specific DNA-methyltransferase (adenine-specific)